MSLRNKHPVFAIRPSDPDSQGIKDSLVRTVFIPLGSLFVAALGLISRDISAWVRAAIIIYIAIICLVVLIAPIRNATAWLKRKCSARRIAKSYYPKLLSIVNTLLPLLEESRAETVTHMLTIARSWAGAGDRIHFDPLHIKILYTWLTSVKKRLEFNRQREFIDILSDLSNLILYYNYFCDDAQRQLDGLIVAGVLQDNMLRQLKQEWSQFRDRHNQTVKAWEDIAKNINAAAGERVCCEYYSPVKTIG